MPYHVTKRGKGFKVTSPNHPGGFSKKPLTKKMARRQQCAIYANTKEESLLHAVRREIWEAECECGCGGEPKGKKARFLPGHDARYHAMIRRKEIEANGGVAPVKVKKPTAPAAPSAIDHEDGGYCVKFINRMHGDIRGVGIAPKADWEAKEKRFKYSACAVRTLKRSEYEALLKSGVEKVEIVSKTPDEFVGDDMNVFNRGGYGSEKRHYKVMERKIK